MLCSEMLFDGSYMLVLIIILLAVGLTFNRVSEGRSFLRRQFACLDCYDWE